MIKDFFKCDHVGRMKGDERREQILQTAVNLFSQRGFKGTTTKEIARVAGVSEAMVFRHFENKDALYGAILDTKGCQDGVHRFPWEENEVLKAAIEQKDDFAVFYNIAFDALKKHQADEGFMRLLFYSALEEHELAERFFHEFIEKIYQFIGSYIEERQRDGAFREMNPRIAVRAFLGMLIHHSLNNILWDKKRVILDISNEDAARNFAEILLRGIRS
ncbi:MAG: TetR/AcrR family transcriptional regulator [Pyrinomonadaceae bacterium]|nr:TetR/AcrR family transcriptional regulator [Acidobacteriota bacterium]MBK7932829.1 TetR/AcrR family transcriptional regulator [Acidobacteriota bacterium]MBP7376996.1 TetR/AcrR family transcriptional regulator [Pyrinomonadaceae bacterium]